MVIKVIERKNLAFDLRVSLCLNGDSLRFSVRDWGVDISLIGIVSSTVSVEESEFILHACSLVKLKSFDYK